MYFLPCYAKQWFCQLIAFPLCDHAIPECELHLWSALPPTFFRFFLSLYCNASVKYQVPYIFFASPCQFVDSISWGGNQEGHRFSYGNEKNETVVSSFHLVFYIIFLCTSEQNTAKESVLWIWLVGSVCFWPPGSGSVIICTDPDLDPDPSITKQISKKNLDIYCIVNLWLFIFEDCRKCTDTFKK